jgi:hypothetical protein
MFAFASWNFDRLGLQDLCRRNRVLLVAPQRRTKGQILRESRLFDPRRTGTVVATFRETAINKNADQCYERSLVLGLPSVAIRCPFDARQDLFSCP